MFQKRAENSLGFLGLVLLLAGGFIKAEAAAPTDVNGRANAAAARLLGVPPSMVEACRKTGFPLYFSMFQCVIADESGLTIADVNAARLEGYSWGEMCQAWGVSLERVRERVRAAFTAMRDQNIPFPPDTPAEGRRIVATGKRDRALRGKP